MSFNGSGTFNINSAGQPVVSGTVISSSTFNTLTADLATGLSTCITKDGQTTVTANIPMNSYKITGLAAGTAATDAARVGQLQAGAASVVTVAGTDTYTGTMSPSLGAYAAGNTFTFVVPNTNTTAATLNIDGLGAKALTRDGSTALVAGDLVANAEVVVVYDGTRFQVLNSNSKTNFNLSGTLTVAGNTTLSGGTANGVAYLNASKVLTTGSALVFDGTSLGVGTSSPSQKLNVATASGNAYMRVERASQATGQVGLQIGGGTSSTDWLMYVPASSNTLTWFGNSTTLMSLNTSGNLGIGTTSPTYRVDIDSTNAGGNILSGTRGTSQLVAYQGASSTGYFGMQSNNNLIFITNGTNQATLDSSGNLGLGVTPSAWGSGITAFQFKNDASLSSHTAGGNLFINSNAYYNGTNWIYSTTTAASQYRQFNGAHNWYNAASGTAGNAITFTQAMTLDTSGNLVLGNSSAAAFLDINGGTTTSSAAPAARFVRNNGGNAYSNLTGLQIYWNHSNGSQENNIVYGGAASSYINFLQNNAGTFTETMRIDSSGNLLVGTTATSTPASGFTVLYNSGSSYINVGHATGTASGTGYAQFLYNSALIGSITQSGTAAVLYNVTSDRRLKDNITDADSASDLIDAIKVRQFDWKSDGNHQRYGMIAQELHEVAPEAVHSPADPDDMMAVDYSKLVPMLVKEIQSLRVRLNSLENK